MSCFMSFFFFFQAEDGIRDSSVTGVQTCALPIYAFDPAGYRQAKGVGGVIAVAPGAASADPDGSCFGIDARVADERQIDDQAIIADPQPSGVVSAAPDGNEEAVLAAEVYRCDDVGHVDAIRDQGGALVDHAVVDFACSIIALIAGLDEFSP